MPPALASRETHYNSHDSAEMHKMANFLSWLVFLDLKVDVGAFRQQTLPIRSKL